MDNSWIAVVTRVGKIHLGEKVGQPGKEYPRAVDYFVVKADESTTESAAKAFHAVYGEQPREITVAFATDDPEQFFPQFLSSYKGGNGRYELFCQGDGETASRADGKGGRVQIPCLYKDCPIFQAGQCKELGKLQFFLPDVPGIGVWQVDTTSFHSTVNLNSAIKMILALTGGRIKMMPLKLHVVPRVVNPDGRAKTVYVLDLRIEDVKIADFIKQAPLLSAAFAPSVDPIDKAEVPEDLIVDDSVIPEDAAPSTDPDADIAIYAGREVKPMPKDPQHLVALLRLVKRDGNSVEGVTDDLSIIADTKNWPSGMKVEYTAEWSGKWANRWQILSIVPVA